MEKFLRPELLVLFPVLNGLGVWLKGKMVLDQFGEKTYPKAKIASKFIPIFLVCFAVFVCTVYGFISTEYTGWRMILDAVVMTGIVQGVLVTSVSVLGYDVLKGVKE